MLCDMHSLIRKDLDAKERAEHLVANTNAIHVWQLLRDNDRSIHELKLLHTPDWFWEWVDAIAIAIWQEYIELEDQTQITFMRLQREAKGSRKRFAKMAARYDYSEILFLRWDGQPWAHRIWKRVKPDPVRPRRPNNWLTGEEE